MFAKDEAPYDERQYWTHEQWARAFDRWQAEEKQWEMECKIAELEHRLHQRQPQSEQRSKSPMRVEAGDYLSVSQAADYLGVSKSFIYERTMHKADEPIPFYRVGKFLRFKKAELAEWAEQRQG